MPACSAAVICTWSTQWRFHSGSMSVFASRKTSRFCTVSLLGPLDREIEDEVRAVSGLGPAQFVDQAPIAVVVAEVAVHVAEPGGELRGQSGIRRRGAPVRSS